MRLSDRIIGLLAILAGIGVITGTFGFRDVPGQQFGSAFFPPIIAAALILSGCVQVWRATSVPIAIFSDRIKGQAGLRTLGVFAAAAFWSLTVQSLGFLATTSIMITGLALIAGGRVIASIGVGVIMTAILHLVFGVVLRVPPAYVIPVILACCMVGSFAINNTIVGVMQVFGVIGWLFEENGIPAAPAILGIVLGNMLEFNFVTSMLKPEGDLLVFVERPIALALAIAVAAVWLLPLIQMLSRS